MNKFIAIILNINLSATTTSDDAFSKRFKIFSEYDAQK